jgi:hypothetical protein
VYQTNQQVTFTCNRMTDSDTWTDCCNQGTQADALAAESNYPSWTASAGTWVGGDNKGASVTWVAPANPQSGITVDVSDDDLPTAVTPPDSGTRDDNPVAGDQITGIRVVGIILTQDHDLWWFNGENAQNYYEQVNLTVPGITEGTFVWTVVAGVDKVNFENDADTITTTNDNTVGLKSTAGSVSVGDVTIVVKINDVDNKAGKNVTVHTPKEEAQSGVGDFNYSDQGHDNGYDSRHYFKIKDQFGQLLPSKVEFNEHWTEPLRNDHNPQTTWGQAEAQKCLVVPSGDTDHLAMCAWGEAVPNSQNPQQPQLGQITVCHWNGEHYIGSLTEGKGVKVFTKKWQFYRDHGRRE